MNRENIFKAKRKDNGEWVEGYKVKYPSGKVEIFKKCVELPDVLLRCEVDPKTICEYTGLEDKNGKKIWENDIVRNEKGDIGVVQWFEEHAAFMIWNKTKHYVCYLAENDFSKIEIAGNEFDNPELLEVEQ